MTATRSRWYPVVAGLAVINFLSIPFTGGMGMWHPLSHMVLASIFAMWAYRMKEEAKAGQRDQLDTGEHGARLDALEADVSYLRQELAEAQERLDFTERVLAQRPEQRRVEP